MKKRFISTILSACTLSIIFGCTNYEDHQGGICDLAWEESNRRDCLHDKQKKVVKALEENLDKHTNQLLEYNREYHLYSQQIKTELSSNVPPQSLYELEQYLDRNQRAKNLFERLVILDFNLIPSVRDTIIENRTITHDLEQNIWLLKQKRLKPLFILPIEDVNSMGSDILTGEIKSRSKIGNRTGKDMTESKEKILNEIRASLKT